MILYTNPVVRKKILSNYPIEDHDFINKSIDYIDTEENKEGKIASDRICRSSFIRKLMEHLKKEQA